LIIIIAGDDDSNERESESNAPNKIIIWTSTGSLE
jgi:hypothetical protein